MTRAVGNDSVEVDLGRGTFTLRWRETGVTLGPCHAEVVTGDGIISTAERRGSWQVTGADAYGRPGAWARWEDAAGTRLGLHLPLDGRLVVVDLEHHGPPSRLGHLAPVVGTTNLAYERRLVDGYDSWAYSGVRGPQPGASFWNSAFVGTGGQTLAVQALASEWLCTRVVNDTTGLRVECGATPPRSKVEGTWGYLVGNPPPLDLPTLGAPVRAEPVALGAGTDPFSVIEDLCALAAEAMGARAWSGPPVHGWESWYHFGLFVSADDVLANARMLRERYRHIPDFDLVQIDDGWQVTYGAWTPNDRFPADLGDLARELRAMGCRPGLWLAPFRVQSDAPGIASDHPDWCLPEGVPLFDTRHQTWALDASHPDALAWLRDLGSQVRTWGFEMVKADFCYLGALEGARHDPSVTGTAALRRGLRAFADGLGENVYLLGCGMPMLPAVGICHGNRVGHDLAMPRALQELGHPLDRGWTGFAGVHAQARNVAARWAQAGRWYDADPEVVMAWGAAGTDPAGYPTELARIMATMAVICGGPFLLADDLEPLEPAERAVLEHGPLLELLGLVGDAQFRPVDVFDHADPPTAPEHAFAPGTTAPSTWIAERAGRRLAALFNWGDHAVRRPVPDCWQGTTEVWTGARVDVDIEIPPRATRLLLA
jgi:alpha-galactosidase